MSSYSSNASLQDIADRLLAAPRVALITHSKPDGDAAGATLALSRALAALGRQSDVFWMGPIEPGLPIIARPTLVRFVEKSPPGEDYDLVVVVDTGSWSQLEPIVGWLKARKQITIGLDHHARGDDVAAMRYVDVKAASATQIVAELIERMGVALRPETPGVAGVGGVAEALFAGLATDTGWFRFNNAGPATFALAARLLQCSVDHVRLLQIMEESHSPARLALEARALASLEYALDGAAAIQSLTLADFTQTGGSPEQLTGIVNLPMVVARVRLSILLSQSERGRTKLSFRSKPRTDLDPGALLVDVNELAGRFGGGGHVHAAGARMDADLPTARAAVLDALAAPAA